MALASTAIPIEWRPLGQASLNFGMLASDVVTNIAGYVPVGIVLAVLGPLLGIVAAAVMAISAESMQFVMMHRDPSVIDVASNVIGAIIGVAISMAARVGSPVLRITRWRAVAAIALALALVVRVWSTSGDPLNNRGTTSPGMLEAHWKLDENQGLVALDSSGHGLHGRFRNELMRVPGTLNGAVTFMGRDTMDAGHATEFRLVGSMTVSAWIRSTSYPVDDAAIVSNWEHVPGFGVGWQLDTTVDRGPRTIGFKLADTCGNVMARYGGTSLLVDTWYHVAGVYDREARTMNVYLNGELDNGFLLGSVTATHRSSRRPTVVGRRSDLQGFEFAGAIDDVRIYSFALTKKEVADTMDGNSVDNPRAATTDFNNPSGAQNVGGKSPECGSSERADARLPGTVAVVGVLVAVACTALFPGATSLLCLVTSFLAGVLLLAVSTSTLPQLNLWVLPLTSLAGGVSVALSTRRQEELDR